MADVWDLGEFTGEEDAGNGFDAIDAGTYEAYVYEVSREVGKTSGKPYLKWTWKIAEGQPFAGRQVWDNTSLAENARWKLVQVLKALGIEVPKGKLKLGPADVQGKKARIVVKKVLDDYANERDGTTDAMKNEVGSVLPSLATSAKKGVPTDEAKAEAKPKTKAAQKEPEEPEESTAEAEASDDDFSFGDD